MKGGLCIIYTSLLTVSVVSSCALFILAVSEALQVDDVHEDVDLSGLHNVSQNQANRESKMPRLPSVEPEVIVAPPEEKTEEPDKMIFPEALSVNSVTTDGIKCKSTTDDDIISKEQGPPVESVFDLDLDISLGVADTKDESTTDNKPVEQISPVESLLDLDPNIFLGVADSLDEHARSEKEKKREFSDNSGFVPRKSRKSNPEELAYDFVFGIDDCRVVSGCRVSRADVIGVWSRQCGGGAGAMSPPRALLAALLLCQLLSYGGHQGLTKIFYTLPDTGQPPILISLTENAKLDLTPDELLFVNDSDQHNDTKSFTIIDSGAQDEQVDEKVTERESTEPRLIVKAKPMHEDRQVEDIFHSTSAPDVDETSESQIEKVEDNIPVKPETPQEDIPSFSEWAQKQLAEAEKKDTVLNHSSQPSHSNTIFSSKSTKVRSKNYASLACGAKVVAVNPEAGSPSSILSPNRDEYMLNTCNSRIWFVVELCEAVQAQKIEIANFELFSSTPKDIAVYFSDRFPTREWASVGQFQAQDMRDVQSFDLYPHLFGKFIKVEMLSHHGSEHYCPISLFKVYGTSEFEVLEKESSQHSAHIDDEDDEIIDVPDVPAAETETTKNLFGSARDAVMSIMKKAAQALVKTEVPKNMSNEQNDTSTDKMYKKCCSPSHIIVCDNCSETLYNDVFELLSCSSDRLTSLVRQVFLRDTLKCTGICQPYGLDFKSTKTIEFGEERVSYVNALFPRKYIAALCNILAIKEKKVVLNTSFETELNVTSNITVDDSPITNTDPSHEQEINLVPVQNESTEDDSNNTVDVNVNTVVPEPSIEKTDSDLPKEDATDVEKEEIISTEEDVPAPEPQEDIVPNEKVTEPPVDNDSKETIKAEGKNGNIAVEKPKEINSNGNEDDQTIIIDNESFINDFDQIAVDPTPAGSPQQQNQNQAQSTLQKESVFLRLSNRVKALERNMSLSGQYLEELSRRYKKQVEEMQKSFEKTILHLTDERRRSSEREHKYLEQVTALQEQLAQVTAALKVLMDERDSWFGNMTFFKFVLCQTLIVTAIFYYLAMKRRPQTIIAPIPKKIKKKQDKFRRKSVEGVSGHATPSAKKRRPSEEAFAIARESAKDVQDDDEGEWQVATKSRRRKTSILHRNGEVELRRGDTIRPLQENPLLDDAEFYAPVPEPTQFDDKPDAKEKELPKTNGSFFNNLRAKTMKTRRLSSPAFLRTFNRQSFRSTPSPVVRTLEPIFNGKVAKKAASESPTGSLWSESTDISSTRDAESGGKKKKSLKNIFKKVF